MKRLEVKYNQKTGRYEKVTTEFDDRGFIGESIISDSPIEIDEIPTSEIDEIQDEAFKELVVNNIIKLQKDANGNMVANEKGAVRRCEFIYYLWDKLKREEKISEEVYKDNNRNFLSLKYDFFNEATNLACRKDNFIGMYMSKDEYAGYITWAEASYIVFYVFREWVKKAGTDWIKDKQEGVFLSTITVSKGDRKFLESRIYPYKTNEGMDDYIELMRTGARYIPLPLYASFMNMVRRGIVDNKMLFKQVERQELAKILDLIGT